MLAPKLFASPPPEPAAPAAPSTEAEGAFGWPFWFTYCSNTLLMVGASLLFRYADFVRLLGGTEFELGLIVGLGMVGSLAMRLAQGVGIDALGPRKIWLWSALLFQLSCLGHLLVGTVDSPFIYFLRVLYQTSLAGFFGASITYISGRSPIGRMAEVIGTLGTSGFVGMATGSFLGDLLVPKNAVDRVHVNMIFAAATAAGFAAMLFAHLATRRSHARHVDRPPVGTMIRRLPLVVRRHHPGILLMVAVAMGFGLGLPQVFLRPYLASVGIHEMSVFFCFYPLTAFITRLSIRRVPSIWGIRGMILVGLGMMTVGMLTFLLIRNEATEVVPALFMGVAHACLFPAVVAGGSGTYPARYRGVGTTLVLAMFDLGNLIGAPTIGSLLRVAQLLDWPRFGTMFVTVAGCMAAMALVYAAMSREHGPPPNDIQHDAVAAPRRRRRRRKRAPA